MYGKGKNIAIFNPKNKIVNGESGRKSENYRQKIVFKVKFLVLIRKAI